MAVFSLMTAVSSALPPLNPNWEFADTACWRVDDKKSVWLDDQLRRPCDLRPSRAVILIHQVDGNHLSFRITWDTMTNTSQYRMSLDLKMREVNGIRLGLQVTDEIAYKLESADNACVPHSVEKPDPLRPSVRMVLFTCQNQIADAYGTQHDVRINAWLMSVHLTPGHGEQGDVFYTGNYLPLLPSVPVHYIDSATRPSVMSVSAPPSADESTTPASDSQDMTSPVVRTEDPAEENVRLRYLVVSLCFLVCVLLMIHVPIVAMEWRRTRHRDQETRVWNRRSRPKQPMARSAKTRPTA